MPSRRLLYVKVLRESALLLPRWVDKAGWLGNPGCRSLRSLCPGLWDFCPFGAQPDGLELLPDTNIIFYNNNDNLYNF